LRELVPGSRRRILRVRGLSRCGRAAEGRAGQMLQSSGSSQERDQPIPSRFDGRNWAAARRAEVDALMSARIAQPVAPDDDPSRIVEAARYSLLAPGKRLRPLLALAAAQAVGAELTDPIRIAAAAVELVHCYSL